MEQQPQRFRLDPQVLMIRVMQHLEAGWVQGAYRNVHGVCLVGAAQKAIAECMDEEIRRVVPCPPTTTPQQYQQVVKMFAQKAIGALQPVVAEALRVQIRIIDPTFQGQYVEGWNDTAGRQKEQILQVVKGAIDAVFLEQQQADAISQVSPEHVPENLGTEQLAMVASLVAQAHEDLRS